MPHILIGRPDRALETAIELHIGQRIKAPSVETQVLADMTWTLLQAAARRWYLVCGGRPRDEALAHFIKQPGDAFEAAIRDSDETPKA